MHQYAIEIGMNIKSKLLAVFCIFISFDLYADSIEESKNSTLALYLNIYNLKEYHEYEFHLADETLKHIGSGTLKKDRDRYSFGSERFRDIRRVKIEHDKDLKEKYVSRYGLAHFSLSPDKKYLLSSERFMRDGGKFIVTDLENSKTILKKSIERRIFGVDWAGSSKCIALLTETYRIGLWPPWQWLELIAGHPAQYDTVLRDVATFMAFQNSNCCWQRSAS